MYAGIDVGAKNLAICIIDKNKWQSFKMNKSNDPGIIYWKIIDALGKGEYCCEIIKSGKTKGSLCDKKAIWKNNDNFYCGKHKPIEGKMYSAPKCSRYTMSFIKKQAFNELDKISILKSVNYIVIETQPRVNQQMKMFAAAIEAYFIIRYFIDMSGNLKSIKSSPAHNKLKVYKGIEIDTSHINNPYAKRKYLAEKHTEKLLENGEDVLEKCFYVEKKRDDLADAFLHCVWAIESVSKN
jgi:hypothetical protein